MDEGRNGDYSAIVREPLNVTSSRLKRFRNTLGSQRRQLFWVIDHSNLLLPMRPRLGERPGQA
jgi:hypothetical protein